jgi:RNA polymerase sigma factor (sigma-70 family)
MARDSAISPEKFEELLTWLDPDRDLAASIYVQLREDLSRIFVWRQCSDPEGMTDKVFDRVAMKVHDIRQNYEGDPRLYFRAVANNLVKEEFKKNQTQLSIDSLEIPEKETTEVNEETIQTEECLESCLQNLSTEKRKLVMAYYAKEKHAKIEHRNELADQLGISIKTLRVRIFRIRLTLEECIELCLSRKTENR